MTDVVADPPKNGDNLVVRVAIREGVTRLVPVTIFRQLADSRSVEGFGTYESLNYLAWVDSSYRDLVGTTEIVVRAKFVNNEFQLSTS